MARWPMQIMVMLGDLMLMTACAYVIYRDPTSLFVWIIVVATFRVWWGQGGFMAWNPATIKKFFANAKKFNS